MRRGGRAQTGQQRSDEEDEDEDEDGSEGEDGYGGRDLLAESDSEGSEGEEEEAPSGHERRQQRLQEKIARLEEAALGAKDWFMQGEVDAGVRRRGGARVCDAPVRASQPPAKPHAAPGAALTPSPAPAAFPAPQPAAPRTVRWRSTWISTPPSSRRRRFDLRAASWAGSWLQGCRGGPLGYCNRAAPPTPSPCVCLATPHPHCPCLVLRSPLRR